MSDIFISYARSTARQAEAVSEALRSLGYSVWRDDDLPSHRAYADVIEEQLRTAKAVVVIWSEEAVKSQWVRSEADRARGEDKLVQLSVDGARLPMPFDQIQCADLSGWSGQGDHANWRKVVSSLAELMSAGDARAGGGPRRPEPDRGADRDPVLAVLPFDNLSTDPEMQFFSDGVSEEIIQRLSRGAQMKVIGRTSSFQFHGERKAQAAAALNASHVLDGSVRRAGERVRIAAHLVEAATQTTQWSDRYDRGLEDIFQVQDEISEHIAAALNETFISFSTKAVDPAVYDLYLRASPKSYSAEDLAPSIALLERATRSAPRFTEAGGRLAFLRAMHRYFQPFPERAAIARRVTEEADRALALDPQNSDALAAKYLILPPFGEFIAADAAIERLRQAPGVSDGTRYIGWHLQGIGRTRESAAEAERLYRLDSLNPFFANAYAGGLMATGRVAEAAPILEELAERAPGMLFVSANLLLAKAHLGDWPAIDHLLSPEWLAKHPLTPSMVRGFTDLFHIMRNPTEENLARARGRLAAEFEDNGGIQVLSLGGLARLGLVDDILRILLVSRLGPRGDEKDRFTGPDPYRTSVLFSAVNDVLRADPRFVVLCARFGLVEFWLASGKWPDCADEVPYDFRAECEKARDIPKESFGF
ncbi:MAG: TIR domain-containing protein [Caulobacterales bacterium]